MITDSEVRTLMDSSFIRGEYAEADHSEAPAALPDVSLDFIVELARKLEAKSVFEFGSGRSTKTLLEAGFNVTSLEDDAYWMDQTLKQLTAAEKNRHVAITQPLGVRFYGLMPVMDWRINASLAERIKQADLILVDSPYFTPFRESTLWSALTNNNHAVVVLDDVRIPTLQRFCDHMAASNPELLYRRVGVGHTFGVFARLHGSKPLQKSQTLLGILKGWRRFFMALLKRS